MSPILVRPVREQLEHDRVIRLLQQDLSKRKVEVGINPGTEQNAPVGAGSRKEYPDAVLYSVEKGKKVIGVVEVETGESVNHLEAMAQWAHLAKLKVPFHLYVPMGSVDVARRLSADYGISVTEIWSYHQVGDQFRFTLIHPVSATRGRAAPAPRTVSVASIRVAQLPEIEAAPVEEPPPAPAAEVSAPPPARRVVAAKGKTAPPAPPPAPAVKGAKEKPPARAAAAPGRPAPAQAAKPAAAPAKPAAAPRKVGAASATPAAAPAKPAAGTAKPAPAPAKAAGARPPAVSKAPARKVTPGKVVAAKAALPRRSAGQPAPRPAKTTSRGAFARPARPAARNGRAAAPPARTPRVKSPARSAAKPSGRRK
jgi:hypothetical protein